MVLLDSSSRFIISPSTANTHCWYPGLLASGHPSCVGAGKSAARARTAPFWGRKKNFPVFQEQEKQS